MDSKFNFKKLKENATKQVAMLQERPEMVISLIAVILLIVGVFSAVLLSGVEQDIRQQAREAEYGGEDGDTPLVADFVDGKPVVNSKGTICATDICEGWNAR